MSDETAKRSQRDNGSHRQAQYIDVGTGEVAIAHGDTMILTNGIGSCVAVVAVDPSRGVCGMAHVMLPGRAPAAATEPLRYAENAIEHLFYKMKEQGCEFCGTVVYLAGGANVLRREDDSICRENIRSVIGVLYDAQAVIGAMSLGGFERRRVKCYCATGAVYCALGDSHEKQMIGLIGRLDSDSVDNFSS